MLVITCIKVMLEVLLLNYLYQNMVVRSLVILLVALITQFVQVMYYWEVMMVMVGLESVNIHVQFVHMSWQCCQRDATPMEI